MKIISIIIWLVVVFNMWIFATKTKVEPEKFKHLEFRVRSIFYWLAVISSFLFGIIVCKQ